MPRRLVWPDATTLDAETRQAEVFNRALSDVYVEGGWCCVFDDFWYLTHILGLERTSKKMLMNARSNDIPFVLCAQRPAGNRLVEIFDQSTAPVFRPRQRRGEPETDRAGRLARLRAHQELRRAP